MFDIKNTNKKLMMTMKMTINKKFFFVYLVVDGIVIVTCLFLGDLWLLNTQVAFMCSMLITVASFISYKNMVQQRVESGDLGDDRDLLDDIEDPHKLYDEENVEDLPVVEKEVIKKIGFRQSMKNMAKSYRGALSPYRIASYIMLCMAVLFLVRHAYFDALAFLLGLSITPISSLIGFWFLDKNKEFE